MAMRVLVTGGAGFIGSHTVDRLLELGYDVRILDNLQQPVHNSGKPDYLPAEAEFIEGDVRNRDVFLRALQNVDMVCHLAAYQDYLTDFSTFFHVNAVSTALLYELIHAHDLPVQKVLIASSQFVAGEGLYKTSDGDIYAPGFRSRDQLERGEWEHRDAQGRPMEYLPVPEVHVAPPNAYALSKFSQEQQGITFGKRYDVPTVALRYSIVQGARQSLYNTYSGACRIFSLSYYFGKPPVIYEDGEQLRDFVNIHDVVDANVLVLQDNRANYEVFSVGGGKGYTIREFERIVAREFGKENLIQQIPGFFRYGDTRHALSDISKLRALGWNPTRTAEDSVREYAAYLREQDDIENMIDMAQKHMQGMNVVGSSRS